MTDKPDDRDGISRRHALECMIWAGTGVLWTIAGGVPKSISLLTSAEAAEAAKGFDGLDRTTAVVLTTKIGRPRTPRYFKAQWEGASKKAGITELHFHDLRGTAVTMLAEAGCTTPQIAAITGHSLKTVTTILDKYLARTRVLAGEAVILFENAKSTQFANRLQTGSANSSNGGIKSLIARPET